MKYQLERVEEAPRITSVCDGPVSREFAGAGPWVVTEFEWAAVQRMAPGSFTAEELPEAPSPETAGDDSTGEGSTGTTDDEEQTHDE